MSQEAPRGPREPIDTPKAPEMKIAGVTVIEYRSGIPLHGFESVAYALHTFAAGRSRGSRGTQQDIQKRAVEKGEFEGLNVYLESIARVDRSEFVTEMLEEAEPAVKSGHGYWHKHFDYDGMGTSFFKTGVGIARLPDQPDSYLLELYAAYVGAEVEAGLAETLGVEQGLQRKGVVVVLEPEGDNFRIDFAEVARRLQTVYAELQPSPQSRDFRQRVAQAIRRGRTQKPALTGERIVDELLNTDGHHDTKEFSLGVKDGVEVVIDVKSVGSRYDRSSNGRQELWHREGAVLTGQLDQSDGRKVSQKPLVILNVRRYSKDSYRRPPAVNPQMKATMNELANSIAAAFTTAL